MINKTYRLEAMKAYFDKLRIGLTIFDISIYPTAILVIYIGCINNQSCNLISTEVRCWQAGFGRSKTRVSERLIRHRKETSVSIERLADVR